MMAEIFPYERGADSRMGKTIELPKAKEFPMQGKQRSGTGAADRLSSLKAISTWIYNDADT